MKKKTFWKHSNIIASLAFMFSFIAANSRCVCIFHQPKMPEELKKLRK
ncbi:cyclic lactone autoinducer peptide [[Ruminococcus] gnavus]|uniref:Cyclic lactone autoinducer peptide n=1 Tax=Mediterraneibacter gnavus TaxID=33038 RepID=A0A9Q4F1Y1_MEDGN|nr:cyclic lactone autoinducer peptide [Mediterraneibacter gnavus]MCZ0667662.1 cyclic lactone autoinducer peptide [Mediterraneibacter gnavus]